MVSIRLRLIALFVLLVTVTLTVFGLYGQLRLSDELELRFAQRKNETLLRLKTSLPTALWNYNKPQIDRIIQAELEPIDVVSVMVLDSRGNSISQAVRTLNADMPQAHDVDGNNPPVEAVLHTDPTTGTPGLTGGDARPVVGKVVVSFSRFYIDSALQKAAITRLVEILLLDGLLVVVLTSSLNMVFKPIAQLRDALFDLAAQDGEAANVLPTTPLREFAEVIDGFNRTQHKLHLVIARRTQAEEAARVAASYTEAAYHDLKLTQDSLIQSEKLASLGGLVAGVAHEINTPIGVVVTGASALDLATQRIQKVFAEGALRKSDIAHYLDTASESVRLIASNAQRAAHLIQSFKQIAVDQTSEQRRAFNLNNYLHELTTSLQPSLRKANTSVELVCDETVVMDSYPGLLAQVLTNLTLNAVTHAFAPGTQGHLSITAQCTNHTVSIVFSDDGQGIPAEYLGKIFDPFFTTRRGLGGTGLGLNIVFNIVTKQLCGSIAAQNNLSRGVRFTISIPRVTPAAIKA
ncbi:MAG: HAMP domain-containing sensor histidine kinase [Rhodoferax sp.]